MDLKVSRKEKRTYNDGPVEVLMDNVCDLFPVFGDDPRFAGQGTFIGQDRKNIIMDVEILNDDRTELLDRAMSAVMWQRGADPTNPSHGIQWAQALIGEIPPTVVMQQVDRAVGEVGPGVQATPFIIKNKGRENLAFKIGLTSTA
jgi:hypothetical protein